MYLKLALVLVIVLFDATTLELSNFQKIATATRLSDTSQRQRLEAQDLQNKQIQNALENINFALTNFTAQMRLQSVESGLPRNCKEVKEKGRNVSQIYRIKPDLSPKSFFVLCNMDTRGGGWTYVLNRFDGSQDFYLNWTDYKNGFGNLARESWLGLEHLYQLTGSENNELLIELVDEDQKRVYAHYSAFGIGDETEGYPLKILGGYSGDAGDDFSSKSGIKFSTKDKDNDKYHGFSCATLFKGAWWYDYCKSCQLTGRYLRGMLSDKDTGEAIHWGDGFHGSRYGLREARMMIRPIDNTSPALVPHEIWN